MDFWRSQISNHQGEEFTAKTWGSIRGARVPCSKT